MKKKFIPVALLFITAGPCYGQHKVHGPIPIQVYLEKYALVPDNERTSYLVELLVAVPDTNHPQRMFSWTNGKLGHVFLGLSKSNGSKEVAEYLGFYARSPVMAITTGKAVASGIRDNEGHYYNAAIGMHLTAAQFDTVLACLQRNGSKSYSLLKYNCVNFSLDAFNSVRHHPLHPAGIHLEGVGKDGWLTPGGVYALLYYMQTGPEGEQIVIRRCQARTGADPLRVKVTADSTTQFHRIAIDSTVSRK